MTRLRLFPALLILGGIGCGSADRPPVYPVSGTILHKGKPVEGATVNFYAEGSPRVASDVTDAAGNFELTTYDTGDGAVAGEHVVTVSKQAMKSEYTGATADKGGDAYSKAMGAAIKSNYKGMTTDQLPAKYADREKSGLTRTVTPDGANTFKIELE